MSTPEDVAWNFERGDPKELHETTVNVARSLWSVHGMSCAIHKLVRETLEKLRMGMQQDRGPDPDYSEWDDERRVLVSIIKNQARYPNNGHGSVNGSKQSWLRDAAIVVTLALSAWTLKTVIEQGKDITRMQCQLSPSTCLQVPARGQP